MFKWSRRSKQKVRRRGNCGAQKLIPRSPEISRAPALQPLKPQASSHSKPLLYRTINGLGRLMQKSVQMHANPCPATNKIALIPVRAGRYTPGSRRRRSCLTSSARRADTAIHSKLIRSQDAAIGLDHGSLCLIRTPQESHS